MKDVKYLIFGAAGLFLLAIALSFSNFSFVQSFRIVFGSVYVLFLPGYVLGYLFFKSSIDIIDRIVLSIALSMTVVPLLTFFSNFFFGLKISFLSSFVIISLVIAVSLVLLRYKKSDFF